MPRNLDIASLRQTVEQQAAQYPAYADLIR